ncbi:MAG TPA: hypothetical protein VFL83_18480 [Anaeromyxobacter sp.]|nr:hypothetical protein [Anaeromyxobacter sp.]
MVTRKKATSGPARGIGVVSEGGAHAALRRGPARELSAEEEKVMRMRLGAAPPRTAPLERSFEPLSDAEIEVRAAEIEAWMRWKARRAELADPPAAVPQPSRTHPRGPLEMSAAPPRFQISKDRIIRALGKKT